MADAARERALFDQCVTWADMPETARLKKAIDTWWPAITTFIQNPRHQRENRGRENVTIKNIKRTGRGYRSPQNYQCPSGCTTPPG